MDHRMNAQRDKVEDALHNTAHDAFMTFWRGTDTGEADGRRGGPGRNTAAGAGARGQRQQLTAIPLNSSAR